MRQLLVLLLVSAAILACTTRSYADLAPPPAAKKNNPTVQANLAIVPDRRTNEARLQISQETLRTLTAEVANVPQNQGLVQRIAQSSKSTITAGVFLFLSLSFGGVWLVRSGPNQGQKMIAMALLGAAVVGAAAVISNANIAPPRIGEWNELSKALSAGRTTSGPIEIEIVPDGQGIRLVVPVKPTAGKKAGED